MLLPAVAALLSFQTPSVHTLELFRGADVSGVSPRYWEVEDTTLDSTQSDLNQGWSHQISADQGKNILIQFLDLPRVIGPHKKILKASLVLGINGGNKVSFAGVRRVLLPWAEGPERTLMSLNPELAQEGAKGSATWRHRRLGGELWQHAGAVGDADSVPVAGVTLSRPDQDHVSLDGLEAAVQLQYDRPFEDHGFVIRFDDPIQFLSSKATEDRPRLVIQYEDAPAATGPDLGVSFIESKPVYERYEDEAGSTFQNQDGQPVGVMDHPLNLLAKHVPDPNEEVVYVAHVKNVGDAPSQGFDATWYVDDKAAGTTTEKPLGPGEEDLLSIRLPYREDAADHRRLPLRLAIQPKGPDACAGNNSLEVQRASLGIGVWVEKSFYEKASQEAAAAGLGSFEGWIQAQAALLNDVYFRFSRFSFATDGVLERVRIQRIGVVPDGSLQGPRALPEGKPNLSFDAELGFTAADGDDLAAVGPNADIPMLRKLGEQLGLVDYSKVNFPLGDPRLGIAGASFGNEDLCPGLMGGGDTRDESTIPTTFGVPYQPYRNEVVEEATLEPTDLLSAIDVAELNSDLGKRRGFHGDALYDTPEDVAIVAMDYNGNKLPGANLTFYQMVNGRFDANSPTFNVKVGEKGVGSLFKRDILAAKPITLATMHTLRTSAFGRIDTAGRNGVFLVKADWNGQTEWSTLKAWELADTYHRGQAGVAIYNIAFNFATDAVDRGSELAKGRDLSDSKSSPAAALGGLIDGSYAADVALPSATGGWVEIDLGRDRTVGEIDLFARNAPFWKQFEIRTYATGEKPDAAFVWAREPNWDWALRNRRLADSGHAGDEAVPYRGPTRRFRYIRIVNTGAPADAKLAGIAVLASKQGGGQR